MCGPACTRMECGDCSLSAGIFAEQLSLAATRGQITVKVEPGDANMSVRPLKLYLYSADWPHLEFPPKQYVYIKDKKQFYVDERFIAKILQRPYRRTYTDVEDFFDRIGVPAEVVMNQETQVKEKLFGVISVNAEQRAVVDEALHFEFDLDNQVKRSGGPYHLVYPDPGYDYRRTAATKKLNSDRIVENAMRDIWTRGRIPAGIQPYDTRERFDLLGGHLKFSELRIPDGVFDCLRRESFEELGLTTDPNIDRARRIVAPPELPLNLECVEF